MAHPEYTTVHRTVSRACLPAPFYTPMVEHSNGGAARIDEAWIFTSVADLELKLREHMRAHAKSARPFRWTCTDPRHRIGNFITGTAY